MGTGVLGSPRLMIYHPSAPLEAIHTLLPDTELLVDDGRYQSSAAAVARKADVAIVFATQWATESYDIPDLSLPDGQDAMIAAVAAANPHVIVVLETGGPVLMPWLDKVSAVLEVWYPGGRGGPAIANLLTGRANPSGRLPVSFPASLEQLPRPEIVGAGANGERPAAGTKALPLPYKEGADVGYRWYARQKAKPLFPFGYGLSYASFAYSDFSVTGGNTITAKFTVRNTSKVAGADVPQVYLTSLAGAPELRLIGWDKVVLAPGESRQVTVTVDRRLLARFDAKAHAWRIPAGRYGVALGSSSADLGARTEVVLAAAGFRPRIG
jgi:beta-glucosidase